MTDPYAPPAAFPLDRLTRAGLDPDALADLQATFADVDAGLQRQFVLLVASVSDGDLANDDGTVGEILTGWPPAAATGGRKLTEQEQQQAGLDPTDGTVVDATYPLEHTVPEVEAYLAGLVGTGIQAEVRRVLDAEQSRDDRDPRVGVVSVCQDILDGA